MGGDPSQPFHDGGAPASGPGLSGAERRTVSLVYADLTGFTALSETRDPEEIAEWLTGVVNRITQVIERFSGVVINIGGDSILALFGAPVAHGDEPELAVRAALEMQRAMNETVRLGNERPGLRVGVHIGEVVAGQVAGQAGGYTVLGDAVNVAQRVQAEADAGSVLVSEEIHRATQRVFEFAFEGQRQVKGRRQPVGCYRVTGVTGATRPRGVPGLRAPMVGRDAEHDTLRGLWQRALAGQGQLVGVVGDPGLGKSRLLAEFRAALPDDARVAAAQCLPYRQLDAYAPVRDLLGQLLGVVPNGTLAALEGQVGDELNRLNPALSESAPLLAWLLGAPLPEGFLTGLDARGQQGMAHQAVKQLLIAVAEFQPLVLIIEDLQWADATSLALLNDLTHILGRSRVLFLGAWRPEFGPPWSRKSYYTQISLGPLSSADIAAQFDALLGDTTLSPTERRTLFERAEGNPHFLEELVRDLIEGHALERANGHWRLMHSFDSLAVPDSVRSAILARIDRLPSEQRTTLQAASVVGRKFAVPVLEQVVGLNGELPAALDELEQREFILPLVVIGAPSYAFRQAATQEVAYATLTRARRKVYHARAAVALEAAPGDRSDESLFDLARHWAEAEENAKATRYFLDAGGRAAGRYAHAEAAEHFHRALDLATDEHDRALALLGSAQAQARLLRHPAEARTAAREALAAWERLGDAGQCAEAMRAVVNAQLALGYDPAITHQALALADTAPGPAAVSLLADCTTYVLTYESPAQAIALVTRGWRLARRAGAARYVQQFRARLTEPGLFPVPAERVGRRIALLGAWERDAAAIGDLNLQGNLLLLLGNLASADDDFDPATEEMYFMSAHGLYDRLGNAWNTCIAQSRLIHARLARGDIAGAAEAAHALVDAVVTREIKGVGFELHEAAWALSEAGDARALMRALALAKMVPMTTMMSIFPQASNVLAALAADDLEDARQQSRRGLLIAQAEWRGRGPVLLRHILGRLAYGSLDAGDAGTARACLAEVTAMDPGAWAADVMYQRLGVWEEYARLRLATEEGRLGDARAALDRIRATEVRFHGATWSQYRRLEELRLLVAAARAGDAAVPNATEQYRTLLVESLAWADSQGARLLRRRLEALDAGAGASA